MSPPERLTRAMAAGLWRVGERMRAAAAAVAVLAASMAGLELLEDDDDGDPGDSLDY